MVEQVFEQPGEPAPRHGLVFIREIPVVPIGPDGDAGRDLGIELGRIEAPLLARIVPEKLVVEIAPDAAENHIFRSSERAAILCDRGEIAFHAARIEIQTVEPVDRVAVDRHRQQLSIDAGEDAMLVGAPIGEA